MFCFLFSLIKSVLTGTFVRDLRTLLIVQFGFSRLSLKYQLTRIESVFLFVLNAAESVWIARDTILRENGIVLCADVLANSDGTDFSYWCAGSHDPTLP